MSVPLQLLCLAALDAVFVHVANRAAPAGAWERVRAALCRALIDGTHTRTQYTYEYTYIGHHHDSIWKATARPLTSPPKFCTKLAASICIWIIQLK
jgi:hypothetical protein